MKEGSLLDLKVEEYLRRAGARTPVPGGGSGAALAGALGVALCAMAVRFSIGKKSCEDARDGLERALVLLEEAGSEMTLLVQRDADAYGNVTEAYALPKNTPEEVSARKAAVAAACKGAMEVPMELLEICARVAEEGVFLAEHTAGNIVSDVGVGVACIEAAARSAFFNVLANLPALDDDVAGEAHSRASDLLRAVEERCTAALGVVRRRMEGRWRA